MGIVERRTRAGHVAGRPGALLCAKLDETGLMKPAAAGAALRIDGAHGEGLLPTLAQAPSGNLAGKVVPNCADLSDFPPPPCPVTLAFQQYPFGQTDSVGVSDGPRGQTRPAQGFL